MRSSSLSNLCSDNNIQKHLFFHFYKFCKSCFKISKNKPLEILTGGSPLQKSVITFEI